MCGALGVEVVTGLEVVVTGVASAATGLES